jgi:hypothetical protein
MLVAYEVAVRPASRCVARRRWRGAARPAVRFLPAVLEQLHKKLTENGLQDAANDGTLRLTPHIIAGPIRSYYR